MVMVSVFKYIFENDKVKEDVLAHLLGQLLVLNKEFKIRNKILFIKEEVNLSNSTITNNICMFYIISIFF